MKKAPSRTRKERDDVVEDSLDQLVKFAKLTKRLHHSQKHSDRLAEETSRRIKNPHETSYRNFGKSALAMMLFMDIVGYSKCKSDQQLRECTDNLNRVVRAALKKAGCPLDDVVCLPSGDGMCLCFKDHTKPLKVAANIQNGLKGSKIKLRMGIHHGGVTRVKDLKSWFNLSGDAINMTQRAMDFGDEHHILCTSDAYKVLSKIEDDDTDLFDALGKCKVKHNLELELFNYFCRTRGIGNPTLPQRAEAPTKSGIRSQKSSSGARVSH